MTKPLIEVEERGFLPPVKRRKLLVFLKQKGKLLRKCNQLAIFCEVGSGSFGAIDVAKARMNIKLNRDLVEDKTSCVLKVKVGKVESRSRKEIQIPFEFETITHIFDFLNLFGISSGCPRFYHRIDYRYRGLMISIKDSGLLDDHFEIETVIKNKKEVKKAVDKIKRFADSHNLELFSQEKYKELILKIYKENPPVLFTKINLSKF